MGSTEGPWTGYTGAETLNGTEELNLKQVLTTEEDETHKLSDEHNNTLTELNNNAFCGSLVILWSYCICISPLKSGIPVCCFHGPGKFSQSL